MPLKLINFKWDHYAIMCGFVFMPKKAYHKGTIPATTRSGLAALDKSFGKQTGKPMINFSEQFCMQL